MSEELDIDLVPLVAGYKEEVFYANLGRGEVSFSISSKSKVNLFSIPPMRNAMCIGSEGFTGLVFENTKNESGFTVHQKRQNGQTFSTGVPYKRFFNVPSHAQTVISYVPW